ncbi:MAG TPA: CpaF family protein [Actinomycetota bacterium]|nr:CpaF family protein [Actinomycetota bacterium]
MKLSERLATVPEPRKGPRPKSAPVAAAEPPARTAHVTLAPHVDETLEELKAAVRSAVVAELGPGLSSGAVSEDQLRTRVEYHLADNVSSFSVSVGPSERAIFISEVLADMLGWGPLEAVMADPTITEIMCNAHDDVWVEREGRLEPADVHFSGPGPYRQVIDRMLAVAGRRIDESSPMADGRLADGSRINAIIPPLVVGEAVLTIRRFPEVALTMDDLIAKDTLSPAAATFLEAAVHGRLNILVSGGTGTGKTTMLNVLTSFIPEGERVVTIEDSAELRLERAHKVRLEARPANIEGAGEVSIRDLVRNALRMRPDRIVVGEVRGGEALDMLQAMNTGHEGSLTTVHANTARDAITRIETMVLFAGMDLPLRAVREQIASAVDLVVQLERRADGARIVERITEIQGREGDVVTMQDVFGRVGASAALLPTGLRPKVAEKLAARGVPLAPALFRAAKAAPSRAKR